MKEKTLFYCTQCGNETLKWEGKCRFCGSWNTIVEKPAISKNLNSSFPVNEKKVPQKLKDIRFEEEVRFTTGLSELDRVLGGGAVLGSLVLFGGAPGIGKSTLLLQICNSLCSGKTVLYVTGEESEKQIGLRAERLNVHTDNLYILSETLIEDILNSAEDLKPDIIIIDSIQTVYTADVSSSAGSVAQVKACTMLLMRYGKACGVTIFLIGHVNKEGVIAGPKVLEHMVDCVLYFEGERSMNYRILRAAKNRYGSTNEMGIFDMQDDGLKQIDNPSSALLAERPREAPGSCVTCVIEGSRPVLAEIQGLAVETSGNPRRNVNGIDYNRANMIQAVMDKRTAYRVNSCDIYINVIGGLTIEDPGTDLAAILAIASSINNKPIPEDCAAIGEVGLTGEIRSVSQLEQRLKECARLGFKRCIVPKGNYKKLVIPESLKIIPAADLFDALKAVFS